ncbi:hypothetical protein CAEBREN_07423 [Caenorhabditis brenneri]|uniref:Core Histone H2A/H2B/H3 domain-containing protein n=1 Tax=Caenorhabditis brenneri TaxID=135651 RepID=G0NE37_CAEBE|nr:hypothetical protein CAEBREN_07423 [Caenorhabditis brenneri]
MAPRKKTAQPKKAPQVRIYSTCFGTRVTTVPPVVHRKKPRGSVAEKEVKMYQKSTENLIPKAAFARLVKELAQDYMTPLVFRKDAIDAIQEAAETFIVDLFRKSLIIAKRGNRATITPDDMKTVLAVMGLSEDNS